MAEQCKDIDAALANLNRKIDSLNKRLADTERKQKECCDKKENNQNNNKPTDLTEIIRRLVALEKTQEALKTGIADIENTNRDFTLAFQGLYDLINPIFESLSSIIEFMGE
jgi:chromosome segregation ATPase